MKSVRYVLSSENHVPIVMKMLVESIHCATVLTKMAKPDTLPKYVAKLPKPNPAYIPKKISIWQINLHWETHCQTLEIL